ncbi:uncharacterized protein FSUBG_7496 [Fusarium subglutinans]|uniref:Uncharacterized protein n=1 Tax=Gibberella subglutinans TaxID=42677 RepID=A0A8H5PV97_GIBSU|nr:uncharacterized protein FSUBG_7496 [Fusarium subglutinans]KAF5602856.1 hypothetical protein FSUBG_7496 [Fusarium subglutinans]
MSHYEAVRDSDGISPPGTPISEPDYPVSVIDTETLHEVLGTANRSAGPKSFVNTDMGVDSSVPRIDPKSRPPGLRWWRRLGYMGLSVLIAGTVCILISCSVLIFLWFGAARARVHQQRPQLWNSIIFREWSLSMVTICSATLRVALSFQTGVIAAAMAAIILETCDVRFCDTALISLHRSSSSGPSAILPSVIKQCRSNRLSSIACCLALFMTFAIALVSTFTSTILLSDFAIYKISGLNTTRNIPMAFDNTAQSRDFKGISFWHSPPLAHWRFARAETGEPISSNDVIDTGDIYRATIPFNESDDRASMEFYRGPAMVTNSRTACVGPTFKSLKIDYYSVSNLSSPELILRAEFQAYIDKIFDMKGDKYLPMTAECKLINDWDLGNLEWPLTMCRVIPQTSPYQKIYDFYPRLLVTSKDPLNKPLDMRDEDHDPLDDEKTYEEYLEDYLAPFAKLEAKKNGSWTKVVNGDGDEVFDATVCFTRQIPELMYNVTILGQAVFSESDYGERADEVLPRRSHQADDSYGLYRSTDVGDLHLYDYKNPTKYSAQEHEQGVRYDPYGFADVLDSIELGGWSLRLWGVGDHTPRLSRTWFIHPDHTTFFQEVLKRTNNPATALLELTYRIYQMYFYYWQPNYDIIEQANTVNTLAIQLPRRWTGLAIVLLIIFLQFITLALTVISFALYTESSILGEPWQAVSQVLSLETEELIQECSKGPSMSDRYVKEWAKVTGRNMGFYSLVQHREDQEAKIQKRQTRGK